MSEPAPLRVALIGYGFAGKTFHAPLIAATPGLELAVVGSSDAAKVAADLPAAAVVADPLQAATDARAELVVVATPNREAAELLHDSGKRARWACLAHLSAENNSPETAVETHGKILGKIRSREMPLHVAGRFDALGILEV